MFLAVRLPVVSISRFDVSNYGLSTIVWEDF